MGEKAKKQKFNRSPSQTPVPLRRFLQKYFAVEKQVIHKYLKIGTGTEMIFQRRNSWTTF